MGAVRAGLLAMFAACSYTPPLSESPTDGVTPDGPDNDAPSTPRCFVGAFEKICLVRPPTSDFTLGGGENMLTTDIQSNCAELTSDSTVSACVIAGRSVTIDGSLTAEGGLPLVLLATDGELVVEGLVDVSSRRGDERRGAGANPIGSCNGAIAADGASGGPGGSFGGKGGTGGQGAGGNVPEAAAAIAFPAKLRGGCPGGVGGSSGSSARGSGGGAVWLFSPIGITIQGTVNASGSGGSGGNGAVVNRGGAGGGTGGMIVLEAPTISVAQTGVLLATGGGGGSGNAGFVTGDDGENPAPDDPGDPADGGALGSGFGGNGGVSGDGATGDTNLTQAGSGGGGGTGFIHVFGITDVSGSVFPPLATN